MRFKIFLLFLLMSCALVAQFIPNKGQWPGQVLYRTEIPSGVLFFEKNKIVYNLMNRSTLGVHSHEEGVLNAKREIAQLAPLTVASVKDSGDKVGFHAYEVIFEGASINSGLQGLDFSEEKINYFRGNDKSRWVSNVSPCSKIKYSNLYKGIDALFYSPNGIPKYDFIIHPGGNIQDVKMKYNGANSVFLDNNKLHIQLSFAQVEEYIPIAYQIINDRKIRVDSKFILDDNTVSFSVGKNYNPNYDLVIDPVLVFSTYSGSTADNFGYTATYDEDGFLYSGSTAFDVGYPYTIGAYDKFFNSSYNGVPNCTSIASMYCWGVSDIAITKYDTSGTHRIYSTYIGGLYCEVPHSLIVNTKGELVIYGTTSSSDYPVTSNAYDTTFGGGFPIDLSNGIFVNYVNGSDIIVTVLSADGSSLVGSTFLGGSSSDGLNVSLRFNYADEIRGEVITDKNDNIYIASCTYGNDLPISTTAFQNTFGGNEEGILLKFNSDVSQLTWASYLGGTLNDAAYSLDLDSANNIVVAGGTFSNNLKTTANSLKPNNQFADLDGFVGVISNDGTTVIAMTYYGVDNFVQDQNYNVKLDRNQNIYLFGQSKSYDSSMVHNANYHVLHGGQFVSKLNYALDSVVWSTTFGQNNYTLSLSPSAFMVDLCSKVYLSAWGQTSALQVTPDAFQKTTDGNDFYIFVLEDDASAISYASFFGGNLSNEHVDGGTSRFDRKGKIYQSMCAGCGGKSDMPIFPANAVSPTNNSNNCNNGVFKMDFLIPNVIADFKSATACASQSSQFKNTSLIQKNTSYFWNFGDGNTSTDFQPNHTYALAGNYSVKLKLSDPTACNLVDSIVKIVKVESYKTEDFGSDTICDGESATINFTPSNSYVSYLWVPGKYLNDSTILHPVSAPSQSISYALVSDNGVCKDTMFYNIIVISSSGFLSATADNDSILKGQSVILHVVPSTWLVNWSPSSSLDDFTSANPLASPQESTTYTVNLASTSDLTCVSSDSIFIFVYDAQCDENDVYVPNIFTPNGDGKNDVLYVRGNNIMELYFTIYDRWGEKVFETTDQKIGWDGIYKGMSSDPAVFVYYLTVKCPGDIKFFTKGNITVMR